MRWLLAPIMFCLPAVLEAREAAVLQFSETGNSAEPGQTLGNTGFVLNILGTPPPYRGLPRTAPAFSPQAAVVGEPINDRGLSSSCTVQPMPALTMQITREAALRRQQYWRHVADAECRHGLPSGILDALVLQESRYLPDAMSAAGALGLAQLMPATARSLGVHDRLDPLANLEGGARFLRTMLDRFGSVSLALAAYNAGPGRVEAARGVPAISETQNYVRSVLSFWSALSSDPRRSLRATAELLGFASTVETIQTER